MTSPFYLLFLPLLLGACSTPEEKKTPPLMSQSMQERIATSRRRMGDQNDRSSFDKAMRSSVTKGKDTAGAMGRRSYKASSYGTRAYTNTQGYKTEGFSGAKNKSAMGGQTFAQADKNSSVADDRFKTDESRFDGQAAREGEQSFSSSDDIFKTQSVRDALRSQEKNERPRFIELEENRRNPAYSEDQVRRLLGRP